MQKTCITQPHTQVHTHTYWFMDRKLMYKRNSKGFVYKPVKYTISTTDCLNFHYTTFQNIVVASFSSIKTVHEKCHCYSSH